jgi:hypothetical protein
VIGARAVLALLVAIAVTACAAGLWLGPLASVDDYADVHVRIYRAGVHCRIDVIAATETISTPVTRCVALPHRPRTN